MVTGIKMNLFKSHIFKPSTYLFLCEYEKLQLLILFGIRAWY